MNNKNVSNSIVLIGPSGVGKSLIASRLSKKTNIPYVDIDDLLFFIEVDLRNELTPDKSQQESFIQKQIAELSKLERETPLTESELKREKILVQEFVDLYNYYHQMFGGFKQFYNIFYEYYKSTQNPTTGFADIYKLNRATFKLINKVFESSNHNLIISPPGCFGWNVKTPLHIKSYMLQNKIGEFLDNTNTILLQPGQDYTLRTPTDKLSVNYRYFLKHLENYYDHSVFEISTNELFYEPENDFLKQRTWLNVRETLTKERLMNGGELDNICDQIIEFYQFHKQDNPEIIK